MKPEQVTYVLLAAAAVAAAAGFAVGEGYDLMAWLGAALLGCAAIINANHRTGSLATAALLFGCNAYLLNNKLEAAGSSRCNVNEVINCDVVNSSAASEMFGIPITLFGVAFYGGLALAALMAKRDDAMFDRVNGLFAIVSLLYSAYLAYQSKVIGAVCVVCITIYIGNALLLWAGIKGVRALDQKLFDPIGAVPTSNAFMTVATTFVVVVFLGASSLQGDEAASRITGSDGKPLDEHSPEFFSKLFMDTMGPVQLDGTEPVYGNPNAPYTVVEWADYGCPHCARAFVDLHSIVAEYPDVQLRFKAYPLSGQCNPNIEYPGGGERCRAAAAAECARQQGKFWEMSAQIFANQQFMADKDLFYIASQIGVNPQTLATCMDDPATLAGIQEDARAGKAAGVFGTPALFLRGTHGGEFVEMTQGPLSIVRLVEAHRDGVQLPAPPAWRPPEF